MRTISAAYGVFAQYGPLPRAKTILRDTPVLILRPAKTPAIIGRPHEMAKVRPTRLLSLTDLERIAMKAEVVAAARVVSRQLEQASIRHLLVGAVAVGVHGWPRATSDVDVLVGPEAWEAGPGDSRAPRVELVPEIHGVGIDYLPLDVAGDFLLEAFDRAIRTEDVPISPVEVVIMTKLLRMAMRDQADVVELVKAGLFEPQEVTSYLDAHAPMLTSRFAALVEQARQELERER